MKNKTLNRLLFLIGFLTLVFYYGLIHPLVPFDTDDWINLTISRPLYPSLHSWNPTKVFPERLEPAAATVAVVALFGNDFMNRLLMYFIKLTYIFFLQYIHLSCELCMWMN